MRRCMVHVMIPLAIQCEALLLLTATFVVAATVGDSCVKPIFGSAPFTADTSVASQYCLAQGTLHKLIEMPEQVSALGTLGTVATNLTM